ncbi:TIGR04255 family protein, partial [Streptomyces sp. CA-135486]
MTHWLAVPPGEVHLARPPVGLVVCQIRHESRIAACDGAVALKIDRALDWRTCLEEHQLSYPTAGDSQTGAAASSVPAAGGWQMQSLDREWTVTVQADHFAIETSAYPGWSEFSRRLG